MDKIQLLKTRAYEKKFAQMEQEKQDEHRRAEESELAEE